MCFLRSTYKDEHEEEEAEEEDPPASLPPEPKNKTNNKTSSVIVALLFSKRRRYQGVCSLYLWEPLRKSKNKIWSIMAANIVGSYLQTTSMQ